MAKAGHFGLCERCERRLGYRRFDVGWLCFGCWRWVCRLFGTMAEESIAS